MAEAPGEYKFWDTQEDDILSRLKGFYNQGRLVYNSKSGRFACNVDMDLEGPYLFFDPKRAKSDCTLYWDIIFQMFQIIPTYCQKFCWKVVVKPKNVKELFEVFEAFRSAGYHGKAGVDPRPYTSNRYAAFIYNQSQDEGLSVLDDARVLLGMGSDRCFLKRGCTEFEMAQPSDKWISYPVQRAFERKILQYLDSLAGIEVPQPDWLERKRMRYWVRYAHGIGDFSYRDLPMAAGYEIGMPAPPVKYERKSDETND